MFYIDLELLPLGLREYLLKFIIMKKILLLLLVIFCFNISGIFAQEEKPKKRRHVLEEYNLKRNSLEFYVNGGLCFSQNNYTIFSSSDTGVSDRYFGTAIRFSSNWYFTPENKNRWYFRTNWITGGIAYIVNDGLPFVNAPLNIGVGDNIKISKNINLDLAISGGLFVLGPGPMGGSVDVFGVVYPEIKLQTKKITIGLIYSRYADRYKTGKSIYHTLMLGISSGI